MRHPLLILVLFVLAALAVGFLAGYRARISQEVIIVHPLKMRPPVPDDLARQVDRILQEAGW